MTFTEAAEAVLRKVGKPLHYKKITQFAIDQNLLSHIGKTPEVTMSTRLATLAKKDKGEQNIVRVKPGVFGLREWGAVAAAVAGDEAEVEAEAEVEEAPAQAPAKPAAKARGGEKGGEKGAEKRPEKTAAAGSERGGERGERGGARGGERGAERGGERGAERGGERGAERGAERGGERGAERGGERGQRGERGERGGEKGRQGRGEKGASGRGARSERAPSAAKATEPTPPVAPVDHAERIAEPPVEAAPMLPEEPLTTPAVAPEMPAVEAAPEAQEVIVEAMAPPEVRPISTLPPAASPADLQAGEEIVPVEHVDVTPPPVREPANEDADDAYPRSEEELEREERLAASADMFPEEDDDEEPLLSGIDRQDPGRRRRRRRRRGGRPEGAEGAPATAPTGPAGAAVEAPVARAEGERPARAPEEAREPRREEAREPRREERRDDRREERREERRDERREEARDEETGRDAADLLVSLLTRRDDRQPVPIRTLVDEGIRTNRLSGDPAVLASTLAAAARVDGARREVRGERPRLRLVGNRVSLTDWTLPAELLRAEADALIALERLRDTARRYVVRRLNELPQPSFTELIVLLMERLGISSLRTTRRPGLAQGEVHLAGIARRGPEEMRVAVVIRRGGDIGRERVIELRGALHHYGPAAAAWIITTGQVLSGARDEASVPGAAPVTLVDGVALGRMMDENDVCVRHATVRLPYLDIDLFDTLRGV